MLGKWCNDGSMWGDYIKLQSAWDPGLITFYICLEIGHEKALDKDKIKLFSGHSRNNEKKLILTNSRLTNTWGV